MCSAKCGWPVSARAKKTATSLCRSSLANVTITGGVISSFFVWIGFVLTTVATNHAFEGMKPVVTAIDAGHWLAVLVLMGAIIGAFGA